MHLNFLNFLLIVGSRVRGIQSIDVKSQDIADVKAFRNNFKAYENVSVNRSINISRDSSQIISRRGYLDGSFTYETRIKCTQAITKEDFEKLKGILLPQIESQILKQFYKYGWGIFEISIVINDAVWGIEKYFLDIEVFKMEFEARAKEIGESKGAKLSLSWRPSDKPLDMKSIMERHYERFVSDNKLDFGYFSTFMKKKIITTLEEIKRNRNNYIVYWNAFKGINTFQNSNEVKKLIEKMILNFIKTLSLKINIYFINDAITLKGIEPNEIKDESKAIKNNNSESKIEGKSNNNVLFYTINELSTKLNDDFMLTYFYFSRQAFFEKLQTIFYNAQVNPEYIINLNQFIPFLYEHVNPTFNQILKNEITKLIKILNISYLPKFRNLDIQKTGFDFKKYLYNQQKLFIIRDFEKFESKVNFTIIELAKHPIVDLKEWLDFVEYDYQFEFYFWLKKHLTIMTIMYYNQIEISFKPIYINLVLRIKTGTFKVEITENDIQNYIRKINLSAFNQKERNLFKQEFIQVTNNILDNNSKRIFEVGFGNEIVTMSPVKGFKLMASHLKRFFNNYHPALKFTLKRIKVQGPKFYSDTEMNRNLNLDI